MAIELFCPCKEPRIQDFSFRPAFRKQVAVKVQHLYCQKCKGHKLKGKVYTEQEWYAWINEPEALKSLITNHV